MTTAVAEPEFIDIMDEINPNFYSLWLADEPNIISSGGRSSLKSSVISLKLVVDFLDDPLGNVVCLRKVGKYLKKSVYEQIKWAIHKLGVQDEFFFGKSPIEIIHKPTGTAFYFYGVDDPQKLKSSKIAVGYVMAVWFEELAEFAGVVDIDTVEDTFIREDLGQNEDGSKKLVKVYYSYNPPRNPYHWVNQWRDSKVGNDQYFLHHSDYEEDEKGFLSVQILQKIENYRKTDYDYWRWMYKGERIGLGDTVYNHNLFKKLTSLKELENDPIVVIDIATDVGHQVSATTHLAFGLTSKGNVVLLDTYYYSPAGLTEKKAPSELTREYGEFIDNIRKTYRKPINRFTIDSAEGALRNQIYKDLRIRTNPVAKKSKLVMIDMVADLLAQGRFYYLDIPNNAIFMEEHRKYQYEPKTINTKSPKVIEVDDHTCDAFQYYVVDNAKKLDILVAAGREAG